ncbi:MAG TPA: 4Fe-4S ferredoxin [Clostridiales bacterium]|nr:4Fe-4S ferredoxin [Clostridiales bacterium]
MDMIINNDCILCGACKIICPTKAIYKDGIKMNIKNELCIRCKKCIYRCFVRAIEIDKV